MKIEQVGIQLFTLRDFLKDPKEIAATMRKVREIGYQTAQVSGIGPDITPAMMKDACDQAGVKVVATHQPGVQILENPQEVIQILDTYDCQLTAYPFPAGIDFESEADVAKLIKGLDASGKILTDAGKTLLYHNHAIEFLRSGDATILDRIYRETNPERLQGEPDTYWVQYGGGNPVAWCQKLSGRLPLIHLKDYKVLGPREVAFCEIGAGNLDFPAIIAAAEKAGCKWFCVEQDQCPGDPFDSIQQSFDYIKANLCS